VRLLLEIPVGSGNGNCYIAFATASSLSLAVEELIRQMPSGAGFGSGFTCGVSSFHMVDI